jgi:hypothetical protein
MRAALSYVAAAVAGAPGAPIRSRMAAACHLHWRVLSGWLPDDEAVQLTCVRLRGFP